MVDMAENTETSHEPIFRANKRRKLFKKRGLQDERGEDELSDGRAGLVEKSEGLDDADQSPDQSIPIVRRPAAKKHGISFSSGAAANQAGAAETALVPVQKTEDQGILSTDRFTKPTGNVGVVEDKHLTAYLDSKLAELRSSSATPQPSTGNSALAGRLVPDDTHNASTPGSNPSPATEQSAAQSSTQDQRKGYSYGSRNRKPRRQHIRDASDVARDAMVDAIMKESQVPLYDQSAHAPPPGIDNDEAAAHAFKAQFLLDLEKKKRKKAPPAAGTDKTSSGPKLGGSRAQREKMRALEGAKNAAPKK